MSFEMLDSLDKLFMFRESNKRFIGLLESPINDLLDSFEVTDCFCIVGDNAFYYTHYY